MQRIAFTSNKQILGGGGIVSRTVPAILAALFAFLLIAATPVTSYASFSTNGYKPTASLAEADKADTYQKNYQVANLAGATYSKNLTATAEWTNKTAGEAEINIHYEAQLPQKSSTQYRSLYVFCNCTAHHFNQTIATRNIIQLLEYNDYVDVIEVAAPCFESGFAVKSFTLKSDDNWVYNNVLNLVQNKNSTADIRGMNNVYELGSAGQGHGEVELITTDGSTVKHQTNTVGTINQLEFANMRHDGMFFYPYVISEYLKSINSHSVNINKELNGVYLSYDGFYPASSLGTLGYGSVVDSTGHVYKDGDAKYLFLIKQLTGLDFKNNSMRITDMNSDCQNAFQFLRKCDQNKQLYTLLSADKGLFEIPPSYSEYGNALGTIRARAEVCDNAYLYTFFLMQPSGMYNSSWSDGGASYKNQITSWFTNGSVKEFTLNDFGAYPYEDDLETNGIKAGISDRYIVLIDLVPNQKINVNQGPFGIQVKQEDGCQFEVRDKVRTKDGVYHILLADIKSSDNSLSCTITVPITLYNKSEFRDANDDFCQVLDYVKTFITQDPNVNSKFEVSSPIEIVTVQSPKLYKLDGEPGIELTKTPISPNGAYKAGDTVKFKVTAKNTGEKTLTGTSIRDALSGAVVGTVSYPKTSGTLEPGESASCEVSYVLKQSDIEAGKVTNSATVTANDKNGGGQVTDTDTATITLEGQPAITLTKDVNQTKIENAAEGTTLTYTFKVKNTGNVSLKNLKLTDEMLGGDKSSSLSKSTLNPGDEATATITYEITASDILNGKVVNKATVTGTSPSNKTVSDTDDATTTIKGTPGVDIVKSANTKSLSNAKAGDTIKYTFTITNTGNTKLTGGTLTDPLIKSGVTISPTTLSPGQKATGTASYTLTQADIDAGKVDNTATTTWNDPYGGKVDDTSSYHVDIAGTPGIEITKSVIGNGSNGKIDAARANETTIQYKIVVKNTGNVTLHDITVNDPLTGGAVQLSKTSLTPNESTDATVSYTLTQADINSGTITNSATADCKSPDGKEVSDDDKVTVELVQTPAIDLQKTVAPTELSGQPKAGAEVKYTLTVTNTGNVTLTGITLSDDRLGGNVSLEKTTLTPGDHTTASVTYTVTQADIDAGTIPNMATVQGTGLNNGQQVKDTDDATVTVSRVPGIELVKEVIGDAKIEDAHAGDTIRFRITVTNTGNVTLHDIKVTDLLEGAAVEENNVPEVLKPGASGEMTVVYKLTQADIDRGDTENIASVVATPPEGLDDTSDDDDAVVETPSNPSIAFDKSASVDEIPAVDAVAGYEVSYTLTMTNTGNTTLDIVSLVDEMLGGDIASSLEKNQLAPQESTSVVVPYQITQSDIDRGWILNTATVNSKDLHNSDASDTDDATVTIERSPAIELVKDVTPANDKPAEDLVVGDELTYTFTITNTGNTTMNDIVINDEMLGGDINLFNAVVSNATDEISDAESDGTAIDGNTASNTPGDDAMRLSDCEEITNGTNGDDVSAGNSTADENAGDENASNVTAGQSLSLLPGQSATISVNYTLTQSDFDSGDVHNHATVTGTAPETTNPDGSEVEPATVSAEDDADQPLLQNPALSLTKTADCENNDGAQPGDTINYELVVTNMGNVSLGDLTLTDELNGVVLDTSPLDGLVLAPGGSTTLTASYAITSDDIAAGSVYNRATASGAIVSPDGELIGDPVTADGEATVSLTPPPDAPLPTTGETIGILAAIFGAVTAASTMVAARVRKSSRK